MGETEERMDDQRYRIRVWSDSGKEGERESDRWQAVD